MFNPWFNQPRHVCTGFLFYPREMQVFSVFTLQCSGGTKSNEQVNVAPRSAICHGHAATKRVLGRSDLYTTQLKVEFQVA